MPKKSTTNVLQREVSGVSRHLFVTRMAREPWMRVHYSPLPFQIVDLSSSGVPLCSTQGSRWSLGVVLWLGSLQCIEECGCVCVWVYVYACVCVCASRQPLWMYFLMTTQPCLKSGHGRFCRRAHVFVQGSKVSMLPSAGPSLLTMPPVVYIFPSRTTALKEMEQDDNNWISYIIRSWLQTWRTMYEGHLPYSGIVLRYNGSHSGSYMTTHQCKSGKAVRMHCNSLLA